MSVCSVASSFILANALVSDGNYKPCLDQFEHYLGKCWLFVRNEMNYEGASTYCRQKSAALPFVNSSDSFFALYDLVKYKQKNRKGF